MAGFKSESPAGFILECMAGCIGIRTLARDPILGTAQAAAAVNHSPVHIRRLVRAGKFPPPLKIGDRKLGWRTSTITRYIETRENIANSTLT